MVPADESPVPAGPATLPMGSRLVPSQPYRLVFRVPAWMSVAPVIMAAAIMAVVGLAIDWPRRGGAGAGLAAPLVAIVAPVALCSVVWYRKVFLPGVTFDHEARELVLGRGGRKGRRALSSVIGVQVMETRKRFGGPEQNMPAMTMYQLNLILDDPAERRLNVMTCDPITARRNARAIADFLNVPVLDSAAKQAEAGGAAAPVTLPHPAGAISSAVIVEPARDVLLIRPRRLALLSATRWSGLVIVPVAMIVLGAWGGVGRWASVPLLVALAGAVFVVLMTALQNLGSWARFDRAGGMLTRGWMAGRQAPRPLTSVKAVEVVGGSDSRMNLVLDDEAQPRLTLIADADGAKVWRAAERVASFLGVPLRDARRPAPAAEKAAAGEAVNPLEELHRSPLPPGKASVRGPARLVPKGGDALVLRPRAPVRWGQLLPAVITLGVTLYLVWAFWLGPGARQAGLGQPPWWLLVLLLSPVSLFSAVRPLLSDRDHFDRQAGVLTLGWFGFKGVVPLAKVLAIQLVPGGLVDRPTQFGAGGERVSYQLNLVLSDADQDRLNLTDDSDLTWARQEGQRLADFLGVPLIDQVVDGD
jgi:hypothetical protein